MSVQQLAKKTGLKASSFKVFLLGWANRPKSRRRIELALGKAIWTAPEYFKWQAAVTKWLGFDPYLTPLHQARHLAAKVGINLGTHPLTISTALATIHAAYDAAHSQPAKPKKPRHAR